MAKQRVIAYFMHEYEQGAAIQAMTDYQTTDSFVIGDMDEADMEAVRAKGLIVEPVKPLPPPEEAVPPQPVRRARETRLGFGARAAADDAAPAAIDYYRIRLRGPLMEEWRNRLTAAGVTLLDHAAGLGYKARLRIEQIADIRALDFVEAVTWISPRQSAPRIATRGARGPAAAMAPAPPRMLAFDVRLHDAADLQTVETWLRNHNVTVVGSGGRKIRIRAAENAPVLDDVGQLPEVDVVAEYVKPKLFNDFARQLLGIDGAHAPQFPKDGSGQIVAVADTGIDENHPDFNGRILKAVARGRNNDASDPNGHGTHVAGSVLGDGSASGGRIKGVAPKAQLFFQSLLDADGDLGGLPVDLNELFEEAYAAGARIHNNSWGSETKSMYTMNSEEVDEFVRRHPDMLIVIAAGNEGTAANPVKSSAGFVDWLSIGSPASCKNALTVGASRSSRTDGPYGGMTYGQGWRANFPDTPIADQKISGDPNGLAAFSSRGPCDDRRIKPDVVAPGTDILSVKSSKAPDENFWGPHDDHYAFDGGTSMATPLVAGCAA
ncbi:MAG TPA: S8 family serine peptidase, partial [Gemmatimonadaceae bacterium]|nr:S8 family serine peptidase [Gemmatimonadaceae bacterium]